jgi:hypothetical protein
MFRQMSEKRKANNADHYAEAASRALGTSADRGVIYVPKEGVLAGGGAEGVGEKKKKLASDGLESLWNFTIAFHSLLRDIAAAGTSPKEQSEKELLRKIKTAYGLPLTRTYLGVTTVDVAMLEGFANVFIRAQRDVKPSEKLKVESMALNAIMRVGGFEAFDRESHKTVLLKIRVLHVDLKGADPLAD